MKYKFKPQTGILVAGMVAATYASACYYQGTSALCFASGATVDTILWGGDASLNLGTKPVIASSDWLVYPNGPTGFFYWSTPIGSAGRAVATRDTGTVQSYCSGPAHFMDFSSHSTSVTWVANSADVNGCNGSSWPRFSQYANTLASGKLDPNSSTCQ